MFLSYSSLKMKEETKVVPSVSQPVRTFFLSKCKSKFSLLVEQFILLRINKHCNYLPSFAACFFPAFKLKESSEKYSSVSSKKRQKNQVINLKVVRQVIRTRSKWSTNYRILWGQINLISLYFSIFLFHFVITFFEPRFSESLSNMAFMPFKKIIYQVGL